MVPQFFIKGFSSNKPLILRINVLWGKSDFPHPPFAAWIRECIHFKWKRDKKEWWKGGGGATMCHKVVKEWRNIPFTTSLEQILKVSFMLLWFHSQFCLKLNLFSVCKCWRSVGAKTGIQNKAYLDQFQGVQWAIRVVMVLLVNMLILAGMVLDGF